MESPTPTTNQDYDDLVSSNFDQEHEEVVLSETWWWAAHLSMCTVALVCNGLFLVTVMFNRKRRDLQTFVTALIVTVAVLDIVDVLRVVPVLAEALFNIELFRHIFCSFGVFHELAVSILLVVLSIAVAAQAGKQEKMFSRGRKPWCHKLIIPLVVLLAAGAAAPFFLLPYDKLSYTCTDPFRVIHVLDTESPKFTTDLYTTVVTVFTYLLPVLIIPIAIPVATLRTCIGRQCCVARFKQPIGELIMVAFIGIIYIGTIIGIVLPRMDEIMDEKIVDITPAPLLWELGNGAVRPLIYFLTNPAVWEGLKHLCCGRDDDDTTDDDELEREELDVPLSPVTNV